MRIRSCRTNITTRLIHNKINSFFWFRAFSHGSTLPLIYFAGRKYFFPRRRRHYSLELKDSFRRARAFFRQAGNIPRITQFHTSDVPASLQLRLQFHFPKMDQTPDPLALTKQESVLHKAFRVFESDDLCFRA